MYLHYNVCNYYYSYLHYLRNIYTISTQYLHNIYTLSTRYLHTIYTLSAHYIHTRSASRRTLTTSGGLCSASTRASPTWTRTWRPSCAAAATSHVSIHPTLLFRGSVYIQNIVIIWCLVNLLDKVLISHLRTIYLEQEKIKMVNKNILVLSSVV